MRIPHDPPFFDGCLMALITAAAGGGSWTVGTTWIGNVAPTAADDAQLTGTSGAITINSGSVCRGLDCTGYTGTLTHSAGVTLTIGDATAALGNIALRLVSGMTYTLGNASTSAISFVSTSATVQTVTMGTKVAGNTTFNAASGGSWQFADAFSCGAATLTLTKGTLLDTNGQTVTCGTFSSSNTNVRTLTLGASSFTSSVDWLVTTSTNLTLNANTSLISCTGSSATFNGGGLTYNNVTLSGPNTPVVTGANTFANLTRTGTAVKTDGLSLGANQTITGTLTINGNSVTNRVLVRTSTLGTAFTLTAATLVCTNVIEFRDITGAGTATWTTAASGATYFGDCGGNSGITFTTAATQTANGTTSFSWSTAARWTSRTPLPQDDVVINNAFSATQTVTLDMPRAGKSITWSNTGNSVAWAKTTATTMYGSLVMTGTSLLTNSGTVGFTMEGRGAFTWTSAGQTFTNSLTVAMFGGTLTMQDAFLSSSTGTHTHGTWDFNNFSSQFTTFSSNASSTRTLTLGSAAMTLTASGTVFTSATPTGLTVTATTGTIKVIDTSASTVTFSGGGKKWGNLWFSRGASTASITLLGSNTFIDFKDDGSAAHSILFTTGLSMTVTTWTVSGTAGNLKTINSTTTGTHALVKAGGGTISADFLNIQHSVATPATTWYAGVNSVNNQAVATAGSGWVFTAPPSANNRLLKLRRLAALALGFLLAFVEAVR